MKFKYENITVKYEIVDDLEVDEFDSVGNMIVTYNFQDYDNPFDIIQLFQDLLYKDEVQIDVICKHPSWIYHDLRHADESDIFAGNHDYIKSIEPARIREQLEWCLDNNIDMPVTHLLDMIDEDNTVKDIIYNAYKKYDKSKNSSG